MNESPQQPTPEQNNGHSGEPIQDRYLRPAEVQSMLGVSRTTLWRWHAERGLRIVTIGGVTRIRQSDLEAFLRKHEEGGTARDSVGAESQASQAIA